MTAPRELSPSQTAARLGTSTRSVQRWILEGRLPARRVGGRWKVDVDALGAFGASVAAADEAWPGVRTVFVANRGEIAARVRRTCDRLGLRAVLPADDADPPLDLLDPAAVVRAARASGADTLHPGVGFLSENADFAERVVAAGIRWIGPPASAIRTMGDKAAARRLATRLGVPVVQGYDGSDDADDDSSQNGPSDRALTEAARRIGPPLIVKPVGGGGGKGMRLVRDLDELPAALVAARREARAAFGDDRLLLERLVEGPRHVEVQVLFDGAGRGIHLGERDCSAQRRHQKVLEETPSPAVDESLRRRLGESALTLAGAVGYVSAGTCEFLLADDGAFFFLEMNARLQVEHPVTEAITGRDLVADQLRIAAGEPLRIDQVDADAARTRGGHAIEVRLYAEDPAAGFLPATGRVEALAWPVGERIRVDAGIEVGTVVGDRFDPLLAKIIAAGRDRSDALDRLQTALDETVVLGLTTNLGFLRWLVRQPAVVAGEVRVDTLEETWSSAEAESWTIDLTAAAWAAAARLLEPTTEGGGWRLNARPHLRLIAEGGLERAIDVGGPTPDPEPAATLAADGVAHVDAGGRSVAFRLAPPPDVDRAVRAAAAHHLGAIGDVVSPMPGAVIAVHVERGAVVEAGDPLVTLEAMKMEHVVVAPGPGTVREVLVRPTGQVARGERLVELA